MDSIYPTLSRPKRKLCFLTDNKYTPGQYTGTFSLEDVDKMFNDLDSDSPDSQLPQSLLFEKSDETTQGEEHRTERTAEHHTVPTEELLNPATGLPSPDLGIDMGIKMHGPMKTSSPIEMNVNEGDLQEQNTEKDKAMSPLLFVCYDKEEPKDITELSCDLITESPPNQVIISKLSKPMSSHRTEEASCGQDRPSVSEPTPKKLETISQVPQKTQRSAHQDPLTKIHQAPETTESVNTEAAEGMSTVLGKETPSFRQRLKDALQPNPPAKPLLQEKVPMPLSDPEDKFLILEDDAAVWISIPTKRQKKSETSSSNSSTDRGTKDCSTEKAPDQVKADQASSKRNSQTVSKRLKNKGEKVDGGTGTGNEKTHEILLTSENPPAVDWLQHEKPTKKKNLKKVSSKDSDTADDEPTKTVSRGTDNKKTKRLSEKKRQTFSEQMERNAKTGTSKPSQRNRKGKRGSAVKEVMSEELREESPECSRKEHADVEDAHSSSDNQVRKSQAHSENSLRKKSTEENKQLAVSEERLSADTQVLGKRKRKSPGQWWLSCPQSSSAESERENQLKTQKDLHTSSLAKAKRDKVLKQSLASDNVKKKRTQRNKDKNARGVKTNKMKATTDEVKTKAAEQNDKPQLPSPWLPSQHNVPSENLFDEVYHQNGDVSPVQGKRRRKPPGDWWRVDNVPADIIFPHQQLNPKKAKPGQESKPQSTQNSSCECWSFHSGNAAVSSRPVGGAAVSPLNQRPQGIPKSLKQKNVPTDDSRVTDLRSGPTSLIALEQHEDPQLPSSKVLRAELSVSDLCAPPLQPLRLQATDTANMTEWLNNLWPTGLNSGSDITPDQFDWYFYRGRALGVLEDMHCGSISNGKILLGSYSKKPLWVDHSATIVFNLLTSSVIVNIDCSESQINAGHSFMVPCGHAYSLQNETAQPAALFFTRILSESVD